jgi:hypothetical protein
MVANGDDEFDPDPIYERQFPRGEDVGYGPDEGFNTFVQLNDERLFTPEALENPVIREFVSAPITVTYVQAKSSTREAEWLLHKPHRVFAGEIEGFEFSGPDERRGIRGFDPQAHLGTFVINHERTLARFPIRSLSITSDDGTGQMIHKGKEET